MCSIPVKVLKFFHGITNVENGWENVNVEEGAENCSNIKSGGRKRRESEYSVHSMRWRLKSIFCSGVGIWQRKG